jgi:hypothetical protein
MHLQLRGMDKQTWADELFVQVVIAEHVANDCCMRHVPSGASGGRGVNFLILFFARKLDDTSVTRSRSSGNARIGSTVTGAVRSSSLRRVMHISRGTPLISAEQDPHFPALQFQRTARSVALSVWIWRMASSTTIPSDTLVVYGCCCPDVPAPRQTWKVAVRDAVPALVFERAAARSPLSAILLLEFGEAIICSPR